MDYSTPAAGVNETANPPLPDGDIALIVSADGSVQSVLQASPEFPEPESVKTLWPGETGEGICNSIRRVLRSRQYFSEEIRNEALGSSAEHIYVAQGRDRCLLIVRDNMRHHRAMSRLQRLAYVDDVTGLPNREYFDSELVQVCEHQRLREGRAAIICFHIDDIDVQHGSTGANRYSTALKDMSGRLVRELRGANAVDDDDFERRTIVARIDFHRIAIILPAIETGNDAEAVAERLMQVLQVPVDVDGKQYSTNVHAGIGLFPQDGVDASVLFANSISATDEARAGGPGSIAFHSGTVQMRTLQRQDLEAELKAALQNDSFQLNYLPIMDVASNEVRSVEALLRWPDSVMGTHSTTKIIGLAERTGLIVPIGEWVLRHSFNQLKSWHDAGFSHLHLAVNFSLQEFSRPEIAPRMAALMLEAGIQPGKVDLEITEKMLTRDAMTGFQVLNALKGLGINLYVDDYGTAPCSMAQLAHSPVDGIKLDNSLVAGLGSCSQDRAACNAAIASAQTLGLVVIAEGVESEGQARELGNAGCDRLQGFYYTKPLAAEAMDAFLKGNAGAADND
jgi:EAL domain-containing protein (putative c-di-GMP-specific phosphodiesterase class I)/GGDEF domain-containing protein